MIDNTEPVEPIEFPESASDRERFYAQQPKRQTVSRGSARRAYELLRSEIRRGSIDMEQQLDDVQIAKTLGTSRNATRDAMKMLVDDGSISRGRRTGTMVSREIFGFPVSELFALPPHLGDSDSTLSSGTYSDCIREVPAAVAARLDPSIRLVRTIEGWMKADGRPVCRTLLYLGLSEGVPQKTTSYIGGLEYGFELFFGRALGRVETTIEAVSADTKTALELGVAPGSPLLAREMLMVDDAGMASALAFVYARGDRSALLSTTEF
jgi:GntR family transcriptional regulator